MYKIFLDTKKHFDYTRLKLFETFEIPPLNIEMEKWLNIEIYDYILWYDHTKVGYTEYYYIDFIHIEDAILFKLTWG